MSQKVGAYPDLVEFRPALLYHVAVSPVGDYPPGLDISLMVTKFNSRVHSHFLLQRNHADLLRDSSSESVRKMGSSAMRPRC